MGHYKWFGNLELTWTTSSPETRKVRDKLEKYYGVKKSKVSEIERHDLCWMLKGFFDSFGEKHNSDYEICIIPDEFSSRMMFVSIDSGSTLKDFSVEDVSYFALKTQELLGTPHFVVEYKGRIYFQWYRNLLNTF